MELYQGDAIEIMRGLPDNSINMVLTDPPYSSGGLFAGDRKATTRTKYTSLDHDGASRFPDFTGDNMDAHALAAFMRDVLFNARIKTVAGGICCVFIDWRNLPSMSDALQAAGWVWRGIIAWDKGNSRPTLGRYRNDCEYVVWGSNGPMSKGKRVLPGCYKCPIVQSKRKRHQAEKPVALLERLLEIAEPSWRVLDPFMGSGSTGEACTKKGLDFVGVELDQYYYDVAVQRLEGGDCHAPKKA